MNTLGRSPHAANTVKPGFFADYANKNGIQKSSARRQIIEPGKHRTSAAPPPNRNGDGFELSERRVTARTSHNPNKRQKLDVGSTQPVRSSSPVDLTAEDDVEVVGLNGGGLPGTIKGPQNGHMEADRPSQPFEASEFLRVSAMTSTAPLKRRRKSKDGQSSSQASSHGTTADAVNGYPKTNGQSIQDALDEELKNDQRQRATGTTRPEINLTRGWKAINGPLSDASKAYSKPLQNAVKVMEQTRRQAHASRGSPRRTQAQQNTHRTVVRQESSLTSIKPVEIPKSPRLSEMFTRDESEPEITKTTAKQRMKVTSQSVDQRVSPIKDGSDSADELAGETTVRSQASRSVSPQKKTRPRFGSSTAANDRKRSSSPSDLQPTEFTRSTRRSRKNIPSLEQDDRYKLLAFYATSCVLTRGDIEMRYDEQEKQFDIFLDGEVQVIRGKQMAVSISKNEVSKVDYSRGKHRVHLRGSTTNVSNGHICIEFYSWKDVQGFLDQLFVIAEEHLRQEPVKEDRLEKLFLTQSREIESMFKQQNKQQEKRDIDELARAKRDAYTHGPEEEIKYEPFESSRNAGRQSVGTRLRKETQWLQSSPYFETSQPRRSSRQTKLVRQLEPSPPPPVRWTKENKPQRWAQSVVYPPQGVRRVTVDFQDLERLDEGEFLNDNLISFALRRIEEDMAAEHKQEVYFFNSFFYTALTTRNGKMSFNYDAVKRWTKKSDLLGYPYVVVPINNSFHWFVAIICNLPSVSRKIAGGDDENEGRLLGGQETIDDPPSEPAEAENPKNDVQADEPGSAGRNPNHAPSSRTLTDGIDGQEIQAQTRAMSQLSLSQEDGESKLNGEEGKGDGATPDSPAIEVLSASLLNLTGAKKSKKRTAPPLKKYDPDLPTIIFLDSTAGTHAPHTRHLKDYLRAEAEAKRGMDLDTKQLQGMTAKGTPEQPNLSDCGLYLIGFVEQFAKNPRQFVTKVLTRQLDEQADFAGFDASAKRDQIRAELLKFNEEQDADHKAKKSAKKVNTLAAPQAVASSPTRAPRKSPKPAVSQTPLLTQKTEADFVDVSKPHVQPTDPVIDPDASFDTGEEDLEVAVPRPLTERPRNSATTVQKANPEVPHATVSPQNAAQHHDSSIFNDRDEAGSIDMQQNLDRAPTDASDEEMLDTAEDPKEYAAAFRSDAAELGSNDDLLQGLENEVENNLQELQDARENDVVRANPFQASNGKLKPVRNKKTAIQHSEVIDLESQDAEPEVPESPQEKQHVETQPRGHGRHTKF